MSFELNLIEKYFKIYSDSNTAKKLNSMIEEMCMIGLNFRHTSCGYRKFGSNHLSNMYMMDQIMLGTYEIQFFF